MAHKFTAALVVVIGAAIIFSCSEDTQTSSGNSDVAGGPGTSSGVGGSPEVSGTGGVPGVACPSDQQRCGTDCVSVESDTNHCGTCDRACDATQVCSSGECVTECRPEQTLCGQGCVDNLENDSAHCGACDNACAALRECVGGSCQCVAGTTECGGDCVDTSVSSAHCGACGHQCQSGVCVSGGCQLGTGGDDGSGATGGSGGSVIVRANALSISTGARNVWEGKSICASCFTTMSVTRCFASVAAVSEPFRSRPRTSCKFCLSFALHWPKGREVRTTPEK